MAQDWDWASRLLQRLEGTVAVPPKYKGQASRVSTIEPFCRKLLESVLHEREEKNRKKRDPGQGSTKNTARISPDGSLEGDNPSSRRMAPSQESRDDLGCVLADG